MKYRNFNIELHECIRHRSSNKIGCFLLNIESQCLNKIDYGEWWHIWGMIDKSRMRIEPPIQNQIDNL